MWLCNNKFGHQLDYICSQNCDDTIQLVIILSSSSHKNKKPIFFLSLQLPYDSRIVTFHLFLKKAMSTIYQVSSNIRTERQYYTMQTMSLSLQRAVKRLIGRQVQIIRQFLLTLLRTKTGEAERVECHEDTKKIVDEKEFLE